MINSDESQKSIASTLEMQGTNPTVSTENMSWPCIQEMVITNFRSSRRIIIFSEFC